MRGVRIRLLHPTGEKIAAGVSDHAGRYQIDGVPETLPLVLQILHEGHLSGLCCDVRLGRGEILRKDIALLRAPRVTLTLTAMPRQTAAKDVLVRVLEGPREIVRGTTDENGVVLLSVPEQGRFDLRVGGQTCAPVPAEEVLLLPGRGDVDLARRVFRGGALEVAARDADDQPVRGAVVAVHGPGLEPVQGTTGGAGLVSLGPLPPGVGLRITARSADGALRGAVPARVRDGYDDPAVVSLWPVSRIAGVIVGASGRELAGAVIEVVVPEDGTLLGVVRSDARGRFVVSDLPRGDVELVVRAAGHAPARRRARAGARGAVQVALDAVPTATLVGSVLGPGRVAVAGARVRVVPGDVGTRTEDNGSFVLDGVPPGTPQRILVEAPGLRVDESSRADRLLVALAADERRRVEIQLASADATGAPAVDAESALRALTGRIIRRDGAPVAAATVGWAGLAAVTDVDGRFELMRPPRDGRRALPLLAIMPPAGLLEPTMLPLQHPDAAGALALGDVALRERPTALLRLGETPGTQASALSFTVLMDTGDHLLGAESEPFASQRRVTYDGAWLHVAAPGAWRRGGHRRAWVGVTTADGPAAAAVTWPATAGPTQIVTPRWRDALTRVVIAIPKGYRGGELRLRLVSTPDDAPLERLGLPLETTRRADAKRLILDGLLRGTWIADLVGPAAAAPPTLRATIKNGRFRGFRPAR